MHWAKYFWVKEPRLPVECEIEIEGPKVVGYPVNINVTLRIEDQITSISGNLTVELYWHNRTCHTLKGWQKWTADKWQYVDILLDETNVAITQEGETWICEYTPEWMGLSQA